MGVERRKYAVDWAEAWGFLNLWRGGGEAKDQADLGGPNEYLKYKKNMSNGEMSASFTCQKPHYSAALGRPGALQASIRSFLNKF